MLEKFVPSMHSATSSFTTCSDFQSTSSASMNASDLPSLAVALRCMSSAFVTISPAYSNTKVPFRMGHVACTPHPFDPDQKTWRGMHKPRWTTLLPQDRLHVQLSLHSWRKTLVVWPGQALPCSGEHAPPQYTVSSIKPWPTNNIVKQGRNQYKTYKQVYKTVHKIQVGTEKIYKKTSIRKKASTRRLAILTGWYKRELRRWPRVVYGESTSVCTPQLHPCPRLHREQPTQDLGKSIFTLLKWLDASVETLDWGM